MKKYQFNETELQFIESSCVPYAVYQFIDKHVVTLALSKGFCELFGYEDFKTAYYLMDNDMYRDTHPDDKARIAEAALAFTKEENTYDVVYRTKKNGTYHTVHAYGRHVYKDGIRIAYIWYSDEGEYVETADGDGSKISFEHLFNTNEHRFSYDFLTGLPSMTYFFELVDAYRCGARQKGETPALLFMDFSGMYTFNRKNGFAGVTANRNICYSIVKLSVFKSQ